MKPTVFCCALVVCAGAAACGGSNASAAGSRTPAAAEEAMKAAASGQTAAPRTVSHETLKTFLPALPGWTRGEIQGETSNDMGISISRVQVNYDKGEANLSYEIMDSSLNAAITAPFLMAAKAGMTEQTADGYTRGLMVSGFPAIETWTPAAKNGELGLLVGGRYLVKVTGNSVPDIDTIRNAVAAVDLKRLATLK
jgi:hypothetical protein